MSIGISATFVEVYRDPERAALLRRSHPTGLGLPVVPQPRRSIDQDEVPILAK